MVRTVGARKVGRYQTAVREALLRTCTAMVPGRSLGCRLFRSRRWRVCRAWRSSGSAFRCTWPRNSSFSTRWFHIWEKTEDRGALSKTRSGGARAGDRALNPFPAVPVWLSERSPAWPLPHHEPWASFCPFRSLRLPPLSKLPSV